MRKIQAFSWYQILRKFEKNLKWSDRAPLKLKNYHKMMNYELCINDFLTLIHGLYCHFQLITNPVSMGERLQTQSSMDIR